MPQAAQHQWSRGGALPAKGHILCCKWFILPGAFSRSEVNNKRISQLAYQIPAKPHSEWAQGTFLDLLTWVSPSCPTLGEPATPSDRTCASQMPVQPSGPQAFSSSLGTKDRFGQLLPPRASNSYSFGGLLLNKVSWNMRSFGWVILLYMTYKSLCVGNHLYLVSKVTLFAKVTKGAKGFLKYPEMTYRLQKHQINIQENISLGSEWQYSGRVTPFLLQRAPRLSGVQHRSSAQLIERCSRRPGEKLLLCIIMEWIRIIFNLSNRAWADCYLQWFLQSSCTGAM